MRSAAWSRWWWFPCLAWTPACGGGADAADRAQAACRAFADFQQALQAGDEAACRTLLTEESQPAVAEVDWAAVRAKAPIAVRDAEVAGPHVYVHGRDPAQPGRVATFVVVKERGRFRVDLVATAGLYAKATGTTRRALEPGELTPADHDRLRRQLLAQPGR